MHSMVRDAIRRKTGMDPGELRYDEEAEVYVSAVVLMAGSRWTNVWRARVCNLGHLHVTPA